MSSKKTWPLLILSPLIFGLTYFYPQIPLLNFEDSLKAINSDNAIFGLMAERIIKGEQIPIYFFGQNYMGPFTSLTAAGVQTLFNFLGWNQPVPFYPGQNYLISPLALQISSTLLFFGGILFFWLGALKKVGPWPALLFGVTLSLGSWLFGHLTLRPLGAEMAYFFGGLIFYLGLGLYDSPSKFRSCLFAFFLGLAWWMNQTIIFILAPFLILFVQKHPFYSQLRNDFKLDSFFFNPKEPGSLKIFKILINLNLLIGLIVSAMGGLYLKGLKIPNGFSHIKISLLILIIIFCAQRIKENSRYWEEIKTLIKNIKYPIICFLMSYSPVLLGKILKWYPKAYGVKFKLIPFRDIPGYFGSLIKDFFPRLLLGGNFGQITISVLILSLGCLIFSIKKWPQLNHIFRTFFSLQKDDSKKSLSQIALAVIFFNVLFILISERAFDQYALRYGLFIPTFFLLVLIDQIKKESLMIKGLSLSLLILFGFKNYGAFNEKLAVIKSEKSPVHLIQRLSSSPYQYCLAHYWDAYKFEYLTGGKMKFIVNEGQKRTPQLDEKRLASPGKKCQFTSQTNILKEI